jgi:formate dehydrogenase subunit gamma
MKLEVLSKRILLIRKIFGSKSKAPQVKLMSVDYRLVHITAIFSLGALLLTGSSEHGFSLLTFHIDFGILCLAILGAYSIFLVAKHRVRLFDALRNPISAQIKEGYAVVGKYLAGTPYPMDVKLRLGRYNILASYASLLLAISFIPLTVGGIAMIFLQRGTFIYEEMKALHLLGVGLIALFFLIHIFAVFNPENRPLLKAMFSNGRVRIDWAKDHLASYLHKIIPGN